MTRARTCSSVSFSRERAIKIGMRCMWRPRSRSSGWLTVNCKLCVMLGLKLVNWLLFADLPPT